MIICTANAVPPAGDLTILLEALGFCSEEVSLQTGSINGDGPTLRRAQGDIVTSILEDVVGLG